MKRPAAQEAGQPQKKRAAVVPAAPQASTVQSTLEKILASSGLTLQSLHGALTEATRPKTSAPDGSTGGSSGSSRATSKSLDEMERELLADGDEPNFTGDTLENGESGEEEEAEGDGEADEAEGDGEADEVEGEEEEAEGDGEADEVEDEEPEDEGDDAGDGEG